MHTLHLQKVPHLLHVAVILRAKLRANIPSTHPTSTALLHAAVVLCAGPTRPAGPPKPLHDLDAPGAHLLNGVQLDGAGAGGKATVPVIVGGCAGHGQPAHSNEHCDHSHIR